MFGRKTCVFELQPRTVAVRREFESNDRVGARRPVEHAPGLHDPLAWSELDVSAGDQFAKAREGVSGRAAEVGRRAAPGGELLAVHERAVHAVWRYAKDQRVVNWFASH